MPAQTHYMTNTLVGGFQSCSTTSPGADAYASPVTGWIVGSTVPGNAYSEFRPATERLESTFQAGAVPDGTIDTTNKDALYLDPGGAGDYASANWTINGVVRANTNGGAQDGRLRYRLFKANADGSSATEITGAAQLGATVSNVSNAADFNSSVTFNPGAFSVTASQKLFIQLAWERTGAGGMTTADINFRIGTTGTRIVTANFTPGSVAYVGDVSETVAVTESVGIVRSAIVPTSESVTLSESAAVVRSAVVPTSETVALANTLTTLVAMSRGIAESVALAESLAAGLLLTADAAESVAVAESLASVRSAVVPTVETVAVVEAVASTAAFAVPRAETVGVVESLVATRATTAAASESIGVTESLGAARATTGSVSESVALAESAAVQRAAIASASESVAVVDALASASARTVGVNEPVALIESVDEDYTPSGGGGPIEYEADVSESVAVMETIGAAAARIVGVGETASIGASVASLAAMSRSLAESVGLSELVAVPGVATYVGDLLDLNTRTGQLIDARPGRGQLIDMNTRRGDLIDE